MALSPLIDPDASSPGGYSIDPERAAAAIEAAQAAFPGSMSFTYNGDGSVATVTENGVTTTYTYNGDGTIHTDTRAGVTRTYSYDGSGNLTGITV